MNFFIVKNSITKILNYIKKNTLPVTRFISFKNKINHTNFKVDFFLKRMSK